MTKEEIDALTTILLDQKKKGQFRAFWTEFNESVNLMASGEVVIESMWSPAVALLVAQGQNVRYAAPPEGFRGWCGNLSISKEAESDPSLLQACYDYINWWYSGEPAALMMRQGYYNSVQETSRRVRLRRTSGHSGSTAKPAATDLPGITGQVGDIKQGQVAGRRLVHRPRLQLRHLELVLPGERVPDPALERVPRRLSPKRMADEARDRRVAEGAAATAPSRPSAGGPGPRARAI